jgi:hypothetical protein
VHAFGVLDQPEHEVSFAEFEGMNFPAGIAAVAGRALFWTRPIVLLEEVDAVFAGFFGLIFSVLDHSWRVEFDVSG